MQQGSSRPCVRRVASGKRHLLATGGPRRAVHSLECAGFYPVAVPSTYGTRMAAGSGLCGTHWRAWRRQGKGAVVTARWMLWGRGWRGCRSWGGCWSRALPPAARAVAASGAAAGGAGAGGRCVASRRRLQQGVRGGHERCSSCRRCRRSSANSMTVHQLYQQHDSSSNRTGWQLQVVQYRPGPEAGYKHCLCRGRHHSSSSPCTAANGSARMHTGAVQAALAVYYSVRLAAARPVPHCEREAGAAAEE